jgi:integrating conjugative element protein (TIGR03761 family)
MEGLNTLMQTEETIAEPEAPQPAERSSLPEKPGVLRGQVWLTIQTIHAQRLFQGRAASAEKPAIVGLIGFANRLRVIWQGARNDDPYADWWLIKIHEGIEIAEADIRNRQLELVKRIEQMKALEVDVAASRRPYRVPLKFANPYAYRGAKLLAEFDKLVCMALTARHIGLLDSKACEDILKASARKVRAIFMIPQGYRLLKINRELLRKSLGRSHEARQLMGEVPGDVLNGERHAPLVPGKVELPSVFAGQVKLHPEASLPEIDPSDTNNDDG